MIECLKVVIPAVISILGFVVTYLLMKKEFRDSIEKSNYNDRKQIYIKTYKILSKAENDRNIVFEKAYLEELKENKAELYLIGTQKVSDLYVKFGDFVFYIQKNYNLYWEENNPEEYERDEDGGEYSVTPYYIMSEFEEKMKEYKDKKTPTVIEIKEKTRAILEAMREDMRIK